MIEFLYAAAAFIFAIALLIAIHEYGHFIVARKLGVKVEKFSIGFGPSLLSWSSRDGEVEYIIAAIPLGGYVKMLGENPDAQIEGDVDAISAEEASRAFHVQPIWKRASIAAAGPIFNFIFAIFAYMIIGWSGQLVIPPVIGHISADSIAERAGLLVGDVVIKVNQHPVHAWQHVEESLKDAVDSEAELEIARDHSQVTIRLEVPKSEQDVLLSNISKTTLGFSAGQRVFAQSVTVGSPAAKAGMKNGDEIVQLDHHTVNDVGSLIRYIESHANTAVSIGVLRGDLRLNLQVTPRSGAEYDVGRMGVLLHSRSIHTPVHYRMGVLEGLVYGFTRTWDMTSMTLEVLGKMVVNTISPENLGGPIAIAQLAGKTADRGFITYLLFLALISVNLGVLNLLPIPILDGGLLTYLALEKVRGKPLSTGIMEKTQLVGVAMIATLMVFAFYNDIARLLT